MLLYIVVHVFYETYVLKEEFHNKSVGDFQLNI